MQPSEVVEYNSVIKEDIACMIYALLVLGL
ncbi:hypothetical protein SAMN04490355_101876 [Pelosinus propionicus DSM 13327]|uniref:Uncharacterized protein n=1 Tax=Pelosinus propionicus DSM 13327 TaxID=1123291 RepID=A0A1I4KMR8_9FIRM|nr:hypothetical protein SAMN04490355_101876 [Pelosinus propionicus DSM 13327]